MNEYCTELTFSEIKINLKKSFKIIISSELIENFAKISGDYNPLHMDEEYAKTTKFKKRIAHGMLLASFFSRLAGMYIPGKRSLYMSQSIKFLSPCFVGEIIDVEGKVISKSESTQIITLDVSIKNSLKELLVKGESKILVRD